MARVQVIGHTPTVIERLDQNNTGYWWPSDDHPRYGDVAAYRDIHSDYIYALGGAPNPVTSWPENQYVYQIRVKASEAFDLSAYEYWWGRGTGWKRQPLTSFDSTTAVLWGIGQGQIVWSKYFDCYIFVHLGTFCSCEHSHVNYSWLSILVHCQIATALLCERRGARKDRGVQMSLSMSPSFTVPLPTLALPIRISTQRAKR